MSRVGDSIERIQDAHPVCAFAGIGTGNSVEVPAPFIHVSGARYRVPATWHRVPDIRYLLAPRAEPEDRVLENAPLRLATRFIWIRRPAPSG
jgi:hypothetical protein